MCTQTEFQFTLLHPSLWHQPQCKEWFVSFSSSICAPQAFFTQRQRQAATLSVPSAVLSPLWLANICAKRAHRVVHSRESFCSCLQHSSHLNLAMFSNCFIESVNYSSREARDRWDWVTQKRLSGTCLYFWPGMFIIKDLVDCLEEFPNIPQPSYVTCKLGLASLMPQGMMFQLLDTVFVENFQNLYTMQTCNDLIFSFS